MEMKFKVAVISLGITMILFMAIFMIGNTMNTKRKDFIEQEFDVMYENFNDMQMLLLMSETFGSEMGCIASEEKIKKLDKSIWTLAEKIDRYRIASEEFAKNEYYLNQKKVFNENQVFYFLLMKKMVEECNFEKDTLLFFFQNSEDCKKCDDQSFILTDINRMDDDDGNQEIAVFSFDVDLNISTVKILEKYYGVNEYPCLVINDETHCGIQDKAFIMEKFCNGSNDKKICELYEK